MCPDCNGRGWIVRQYVLFSDGSYSEVEQISERCACNPAASDEDAPFEPDGERGFDDFEASLPARLLAS